MFLVQWLRDPDHIGPTSRPFSEDSGSYTKCIRIFLKTVFAPVMANCANANQWAVFLPELFELKNFFFSFNLRFSYFIMPVYLNTTFRVS